MTKSTTTREESIQAIFDLKVGYSLGLADIEILKRVARMALAAMDSEPVDSNYRKLFTCTGCGAEGLDEPLETNCHCCVDGAHWVESRLYRHAQPAPEREQVRQEHAEWSQETFGNVGPVGPLKHLSKEALEAAEQPGDLSEWADMQFLLWDAQRRAGITDEQITQAMIEKLVVNKQREWPEPKDGEPRLHIKAQPAPAVQCPYPCGWDNLNKLAIQDAALVARGLVEGEPTTEAQRQAAISNNDRLLKIISACRAAMLQAEPVTKANKLGNSPVIPDGYVMVPKEPTDEMQSAGASAIRIETTALNKLWTGNAVFRAMLAAAPQDTPALDSVQSVVTVSDTWIPVSERNPDDIGRYWCYVEDQKSHGKYSYQWNCSWNGSYWSGAMMHGRVTHWMPLPNPPKEVK